MAYAFSSTAHKIVCGTGSSPIPFTGSLMFRFYPTTVSNDAAFKDWFDCRTDGSNLFHVTQGSGRWFAGWVVGGTDYRFFPGSIGHWVQNAWNTLVITWDNVTHATTMWTNGVNRGNSSSFVPTTTTGAKAIGNEVAATTNGNASMAEVALFSQVLPPAVIAAFDRGYSPGHFKVYGGINYWPLADNAADIWNREHGVVTGAAAVPSPYAIVPKRALFVPGSVATSPPPPASFIQRRTGGGLGTRTGSRQVA